MAKSEYLPSIGIETHVQLKTRTKLFSAVSNDARAAKPNSLISHIDAGLPGALPVLNEEAVRLTTVAGLAVGGEIQPFSRFDRKHYFYPDLPKGYQISQYQQPLVVGGGVDITVAGKPSRIGLVRVHLEEDAGKNTHPDGANYSLVDLNRAGTPLIEIVSQPDIHSPAEAKAFVRELYLVMKYAGVSDGDLYHGNIRFDINVSLSDKPGQLGIRSEVKNLNSFRSVENAAAFEIERQTSLLKRGEKNIQETRGWDEAKQKTISQRGKEEAHDYRYMPEPDIPSVELSSEYIAKTKASLPKLPAQYRTELKKLNIDSKVVEDLLDRPQALEHLFAAMTEGAYDEAARNIAFWTLKHAGKLENSQADAVSRHLVDLAEMRANNQLSSTAADQVFQIVVSELKNPQLVAEELGLVQVSDEAELEKIVDEVLTGNAKAADDVRSGQTKAIGFLVGQVMKESRGRANPKMVEQIIKNQLGV